MNLKEIKETKEYKVLYESYNKSELAAKLVIASQGLADYLETHYEVVSLMNNHEALLDCTSTGKRWELAKEWTDEFQELHQNTDWLHNFHDTVVDFVLIKIEELLNKCI